MTGGAPQLGNWQLQQVVAMTLVEQACWEAEVRGGQVAGLSLPACEHLAPICRLKAAAWSAAHSIVGTAASQHLPSHLQVRRQGRRRHPDA